MGRPISWFEICSPRHEELRSYYADLFGWAVTPLPGMDYALVDTGGPIGGGITSGEDEVVVYVEVDDLDAGLRRAEELGGRVVVPVTEIPDMATFAQVADPSGNVVGLVLASSTDPAPPPADDQRPAPKWVLLYDTSEDAPRLVPLHFPAHHEWVERFRSSGDLLLVGTFADPMADGSMSVFRSQDAAERFVEGDPFRTGGVVRSWRIMEWHELLVP